MPLYPQPLRGPQQLQSTNVFKVARSGDNIDAMTIASEHDAVPSLPASTHLAESAQSDVIILPD